MCFVIFSTFLRFFMTLKFARFCYFWFLVVFRALKFAHFWDLGFLVVFRELKFGLFLVIFAFWHGCRREMIVFFLRKIANWKKKCPKVLHYTLLASGNLCRIIGGQWVSGQNVLTFFFFFVSHKKHLTYTRSDLRWVEI